MVTNQPTNQPTKGTDSIGPSALRAEVQKIDGCFHAEPCIDFLALVHDQI